MRDLDMKSWAEPDEELRRLKQDLEHIYIKLSALRNSVHACNRNPIPNSRRIEWRGQIDNILSQMYVAFNAPSKENGEGD